MTSNGATLGTDPRTGLTADQVAQRTAEGRTNEVASPTSRTYRQILAANIFTRFNAVLGSLLVAILAVGQWRDALFGIVLVLNALIGITQESRSKRTLDRLTLLSAPEVMVRRDGVDVAVPNASVVADDLVVLRPGDQVTVDGEVTGSDGLEIDESLLTGEADAVAKDPGDEVMSGSFVAAGSGTIVATAVGSESYAQRIGSDARRFTMVRSELRDGINSLVRIVQWMMIPTAVLLVVSQVRSGASVVRVVQGSVAGLGAMIPEGLVLLTSTALALGVIRLGRRKVLTQELAAIEGLARVDVLCIDKTGTLTEGRLTMGALDTLPGSPHGTDPASVLAAMAAGEPNPNPSLTAIAEGVSSTDRPTGSDATDITSPLCQRPRCQLPRCQRPSGLWWRPCRFRRHASGALPTWDLTAAGTSAHPTCCCRNSPTLTGSWPGWTASPPTAGECCCWPTAPMASPGKHSPPTSCRQRCACSTRPSVPRRPTPSPGLAVRV